MTDALNEKMKKLYPTAKKVLDSYSGSATEKEALKRTEKRVDDKMVPFPELRMHKKWRSYLVKEGLLIGIKPNGKVPWKWYPYYDNIAAPTDSTGHSASPQMSSSVQNEREGGRLEESGIYVKSMSLTAFAISIQSVASGILDLFEDNRNVGRREIRRLCNSRIAPAVRRILASREEGLLLTTPQEYFLKQRGEEHRYDGGRKKLKGTLGVPISGSLITEPWIGARSGWMVTGQVGEEDVIFPDLLDWAKYLSKVSEEVQELGARYSSESS